MKYSKITIKNKLFKKPMIEIPEEVLGKCVPVKADSKDKSLYIGVSEGVCELRAILPGKDTVGFNICLKPEKNSLTYKEITGFFSFRGDVFYRVKGSAGKDIKTGVAFMEFIKDKYPEEFEKCKVTDVSKLEVTPLKVR